MSKNTQTEKVGKSEPKIKVKVKLQCDFHVAGQDRLAGFEIGEIVCVEGIDKMSIDALLRNGRLKAIT